MNKGSAWLAAIVICLLGCWAVADGYVPELVWTVGVRGIGVRSQNGWLILKRPGYLSEEHFAYQVLDPISARPMLTLHKQYHNCRVSSCG